MAEEVVFVGERAYKVVRHFRKRPRPTGRFKTVYVADRTGRKHRTRVPEMEQKLVFVGKQFVRLDTERKLGRRARRKLEQGVGV